jgi:hypothetical protein
MSRRKYGSLANMPKDECAPTAGVGYSQHVKLIHYLLQEYGSFEFILDMADSSINFLNKIFRKNKRLQTILTLLKYGIPAVVILSEFVAKIKRFYIIKSGKNNVSNESVEKVRELFGLKDDKVNIDNYPFIVGSEVTQWLLQRPKTKHFKILGYHQYDNLQHLSDTYKEDDSTIITVMEMDGVKFAWLVRMYRSTEEDLYVRLSDVYTTMDNISKINTLKGLVYKEFIQHFNITDNVLLMSSSGLMTYPRQEIVESPKQFNIKKFSTEIRKILKRKKKRGFVFVGVPGTGKSTIIHCLESVITEYPIVYLSSNCFSGPSMVKETFNTLRYIQPCIAIIEDLDSCELKDKRQALGEFLEQIDDVDNSLNLVILATVNDTSLVHYSLINRPGRFDEVIMVKTPQDIEEVYGIMKCRYDKNKKVDPDITKKFMSFGEINHVFLQDVIDKKFTQADVCEIIEKALLIDNVITNETFNESLKSLEESKRALKECNFGGGDPFKYTKDEEDEVELEYGYGQASSQHVYPANRTIGGL